MSTGQTPPNEIRFVPFAFAERVRGVTAGYALATGGVSTGPYTSLNMSYNVGDAEANVTENRRRLMDHLGLDPATLTMGQQVHDGRVQVIEPADVGRGGLDPATAIANTDGLVTNDPNAVLGVLQADCVPIVVYDPVNRAIAAAHSGWPGTVAKMATNVCYALTARFGSDPADLHAAIGPSIGPQSYEVKEDVAAQARVAFAGTPGGDAVMVTRADGTMAFDLWHANRIQLLDAGIPEANIELTAVDSYDLSNQLFSHRQAAPSGRFLCLATLTQT